MKLQVRRWMLCSAITVLATPVCWADPRAEVNAAVDKAMQASSFQVDMQQSGTRPVSSELHFVAPDRYRLNMAGVGEQTVIGDTLHMTMQGQTTAVPLPAGTLTQWRDPVRLAANAETMTVTALGDEAIDGAAAKKYRVEQTQPQPSTLMMWIGGDGYPAQIVTSNEAGGENITVTIRYSRFNDPAIRVDAPN